MEQFLKNLEKSGSVILDNVESDIAVSANGKVLALYSPEDSRLFIRADKNISDPLSLLVPTSYREMNRLLTLDNEKSLNYARFIINSLLSSQESSEDESGFCLEREIEKVILSFMDSDMISKDCWHSIMTFAKSYETEDYQSTVLQALYRIIITRCEQMFTEFNVDQKENLITISSGSEKTEFCILDSRKTGSMYFRFKSPPLVKGLSETKKQDWFSISPMIQHQDFSFILDLFKESLGQSIHGRFWKSV